MADEEERMIDEPADRQLPKYLSKTSSGSKCPFAIQTLSMYIQDKMDKQQSALLPHEALALEPIPAARVAARPLGLTRGTTLYCEKDIKHHDLEQEQELRLAARPLCLTRGTTLHCEKDIEYHDLEREIRLAEKENRKPIRPRKRPSQGGEGCSPLKRQRGGGGGSDNGEEKEIFNARDVNLMHVTTAGRSPSHAFSSRFTLGTYVRKSEMIGRRPSSTSVTTTDSYFVSLRRSAIAYAEKSKAARKTKGRVVQPPQ